MKNHSRSCVQDAYRNLPSVDKLLQQPEIALLAAQYGQPQMTDAVRAVLADARQRIAAGEQAPAAHLWPQLVSEHLLHAEQPSLLPLINATGIIVHTNLGRAPLSRAALSAIQTTAQGYSNLEYALPTGERGSRHDHARQRLQQITGAEDALVVNNNAAAVFLVLTTFCRGRRVLISRGQLVEIGGGFRIPDVLRQSGAELVEVGTTNRTRASDFTAAIDEQTAAIMRVHSSNFKQIGFVAMPELVELAEIAHDPVFPFNPLLLIDDLGSGTLLDTTPYGLAPEPMVQQSLAAGADLVTFSGDKLLGGPQAGLIVGRKELIEDLRRHPLARALRVDKLTLAALDATLRSYQRGRAIEEIPVWQMIAAPLATLHARAERWQAALLSANIAATIWQGESAVGGGSLPGETLPTWLLALPAPRPDALAAQLRSAAMPVVCRIQKQHLLFDPRTLRMTVQWLQCHSDRNGRTRLRSCLS
jgi:L-seryl-tRNA(Ser) seleniumtransferase